MATHHCCPSYPCPICHANAMQVWAQYRKEWPIDYGVSPCFAFCGEPACKKLGCVRVYNAEHRNDEES